MTGLEVGFEVGRDEGRATPGGGAIAPRRGAPALPCQSSNNCTELPSGLTPYQRKNAYSLAENIAAMVEAFGIERIGFLTLTFPKDLTLREANRRFHSLVTHELSGLFEAWVNAREFTGLQRPHMHLVVAAKGDIREGFSHATYLKMARLTRSKGRKARAAEIRELSRSLTPNPLLRALWSKLRDACPRYQFGRHELIPIRKEGAAIARYVGGYIRKSMEGRPESAKGSRLVTYSQDFPRRVLGHSWQWNTPGTAAWRRKLEWFAKLHGVKCFEDLSRAFGPRWAFWLRDLIETLNLGEHGEIQPSESFDLIRFLEVEQAHPFHLSPFRLHLYPPRVPVDEKGNPIPLPRRIQPVFAWHLENWHRLPDPF